MHRWITLQLNIVIGQLTLFASSCLCLYRWAPPETGIKMQDADVFLCHCTILVHKHLLLNQAIQYFPGIANIFWAVIQKIFVKHPFTHPGIRLIPLIWTFHKYQSQHYFHITINYWSAMIKCHFVWYVSITLYKYMWYKVNFIKFIVI